MLGNVRKLYKIWSTYYYAVIVLVLQDKSIRYQTKEIIQAYDLHILLNKEIDTVGFFNIIICF